MGLQSGLTWSAWSEWEMSAEKNINRVIGGNFLFSCSEAGNAYSIGFAGLYKASVPWMSCFLFSMYIANNFIKSLSDSSNTGSSSLSTNWWSFDSNRQALSVANRATAWFNIIFLNWNLVYQHFHPPCPFFPAAANDFVQDLSCPRQQICSLQGSDR